MKKAFLFSVILLILILSVKCTEQDTKKAIAEQKLKRSAGVRDSLSGEIVFKNIFCSIRKVSAKEGDIGIELSNGDCGSVPQWSPDGSKIAFIYQKLNPQSNTNDSYLKIIDKNGLTVNEWTLEPSLHANLSLTWSPDALTIAVLMDDNRILYVKTLTGEITETRLLSGPDEYYRSVAWCPAGNKIAVSVMTGARLYSILLSDAYGNDPRTGSFLVENSGQDMIEAGHMDWSPDGTMLAYSGNSFGSIYIVNSDGSGNRELVLNGIYEDEEIHGYAPSWSSDSKQIVFTGDTGINGSTLVSGLFVTNINGSYKVDIQIPGDSPDWY